MNWQQIKDKTQNTALVCSLLCLLLSIWVAFAYLRLVTTCLFWVAFLLTLIFAFISLPRKQSLLSLGLIAASFLIAGERKRALDHYTVDSPDPRFKFELFRLPLPFAMPGGGGDAPAYVQLRTASGKILEEGYLDMVQLFEVHWNDAGKIRIGPHGENTIYWDIPK